MASGWTLAQVDKFLGRFDEIDTSHNGMLSFREVARALAASGYRRGYFDTKKLFTEIDADDNKQISREEYKEVLSKLPCKEVKIMSLRNQFLAMDKDNSGDLTKEEVMSSFRNIDLAMEAEKVADLLIGLVKDKDGRLNYEEFLVLYEKKE